MEIKITEPVLSGLTESPRRLSEMLAGESEILGLSFAGQTAAGIVKEYLSVSHAVFSGCTLGGNCFRDTQLSDVLFENCDLSNLEFSGGMVRVRFSGCRMTGMSLGGVKLMQVSVSRCGGRYMAFSFVRSRRLLFTECDLQESLFNDCRFVSSASSAATCASRFSTGRRCRASICAAATRRVSEPVPAT